MATTTTRIGILAIGIRDTAGAVVASGYARFYNPGTLVAATVYSDSACATAKSQPVVLNAGGQATVYTLEPVRMIVKDSTETATYYDDVPDLQRAESIYITETGFNGGVETTFSAVLAEANSAFGEGFQYQESDTAEARNFPEVIRNFAIQAEDYGVVADGVTDDTTAMQDAINRVEALGGGRLLLPPGTILISSALTIDTAGVSIEGQGRGISIIKQSSTSANTLVITMSSGDCKLFLRKFSITASTTTSGVGIYPTVGNYLVIEEVAIGLHRTAFGCGAVTGTELRRCFVDSTDGNASALGIDLGIGARAIDCEVNSATDAGIGIKFSGADARATDCYVSNFVTGISCAAARGVMRAPHVTGSTTGITISASDGAATDAYVVGCTTGISLTSTYARVNGALVSTCTTGISVGAVAGATVIGSSGTGNTTDLSVNTSATLFLEHSNVFSTGTYAATSGRRLPKRSKLPTVATSGVTPATFTPDITTGNIQRFRGSYAGGAQLLTVANHATTTLTEGDEMTMIIEKTGANVITITWGTQYKFIDATTNMASMANVGVTVQTLTAHAYYYYWNGTQWLLIAYNNAITVV